MVWGGDTETMGKREMPTRKELQEFEARNAKLTLFIDEMPKLTLGLGFGFWAEPQLGKMVELMRICWTIVCAVEEHYGAG